jgi:hypothetical protein
MGQLKSKRPLRKPPTRTTRNKTVNPKYKNINSGNIQINRDKISQKILPTVSEIPPIENNNSVDLIKYFPVRRYFTWQKVFLLLVLTVISWLNAIFITPNIMAIKLSLIITLATIISFIYWEIYRLSIVLKIEQLRLIACRGVPPRVLISAPFTPYWDFQICQNQIESLFGLYRFKLSGDFIQNPTLMELPGLSLDKATLLLRYLSEQTDKFLSVSAGALQEEEKLH